MHHNSKDIQNQYIGFLNTASLWKDKTVYDLHQFYIEPQQTAFNLPIDTNLRLGKYIERFVSFQLQQDANVQIISENIQIQQEKITLGELDCILYKDQKPIHLEVIYKFYLYDDTVGIDEIEHFIGPNRKDSLVEKLTKLRDKQLPLLFSSECVTYLNTLNLKANKLDQQVYFKAQLFVPYSNRNIHLEQLNPGCIAGYYINQLELYQFEYCKFYIPNKKDWLVAPHTHVDWVDFDSFFVEFNKCMQREFSPLCWIKHENGTIDKAFVVWW